MINFYSDRKSDTGAHDVSSGIITDLDDNISQNPENASDTDKNGLERTGTDGAMEGKRTETDEVLPETETPYTLTEKTVML